MAQERHTLILPDFLEVDEDEVHDRMLGQAPENYDTSEGSLFWDATRPTALEVSEIMDSVLPLVIVNMFPQFAEGYFLDYHGERESVTRREATYSTGKINIKGADGTFIPAGTTVTTDEVDGITLEYRTTEDATIDASGVVEIRIEALEAGASGNVPADSIVNFLEPISGVQSLNNNEEMTGGIDEEDDDTYRERILLTNQTRSFTGNKADYIRWAKEITGVGEVLVVPEWDGPGTVKVLIASSTGSVPSQATIDEVQNHIAPDERDGGGLAPIGALVTVTSINSNVIDVSFTVTLEDDFSIDAVIQAIKMQLSVYFSEEIEQGGLVRYTKIGAIIMTTPGIVDYDNLQLNGGIDNIQLEPDEVAVVGEVTTS